MGNLGNLQGSCGVVDSYLVALELTFFDKTFFFKGFLGIQNSANDFHGMIND